jgi:pimeloyl-ACP methyl ester carboxylesterase
MMFLVAWIICGTLLLMAGYLYQQIGDKRDAPREVSPGRMISVGGHRLHLVCKGSRGPTVVIEQGAGEPSNLWWPIQDKVAEFARVCTYDRPGYGLSEAVPAPRTIEDRAAELHALLVNAEIPGPFVLVAHSYGGLIVRLFARDHRESVAGLVLVDTTEEGVFSRKDILAFYAKIRVFCRALALTARFGALRLLRDCFPHVGAFGFPSVQPSYYLAAADDVASVTRASAAIKGTGGIGTLDDLPLAVITHGQPFPGPFAILENGWSEGQVRLAALSTNSQLVVAHNSNHMINQDEPALVVDVIRRVCEAARTGSKLSPA